MRPRVAAAEISHETNVFSSTPTDYAAFQASGLYLGNEIVAAKQGTNSAFGGFLAAAPGYGIELLPLISVWATPSGLVTRDAFEKLATHLQEGIWSAQKSGGLDGVLLALHGAMVAEHERDADALLLELVREAAGGDTPVVATLDLHANISPRMVTSADLLIGYDTYPHIDMADRAAEACQRISSIMAGEYLPAVALVKPPMLPTSQRMMTSDGPMADLMALTKTAEKELNVIVSVAGGFPPSDVREAGLSVVVSTNNDPDRAQEIAFAIATNAFKWRERFLGGVSTFQEAAVAIEAAKPAVHHPLLVVDIGDNPWSGGPGDSAELLRFFLSLNAKNAAIAVIVDSSAVEAAVAAGIGTHLSLSLGGKTDRLHGPPLIVTAEVRGLYPGRYVNDGPMMAGLEVNLGPTAVLQVEGVQVVVTSRAETPIDLNVFRVHGIEPTKLTLIGLKGKGHFRAAFEPIVSEVVLVEGPGITGADLSRLPFQHLTRPIWPLDSGVSWP